MQASKRIGTREAIIHVEDCNTGNDSAFSVPDGMRGEDRRRARIDARDRRRFVRRAHVDTELHTIRVAELGPDRATRIHECVQVDVIASRIAKESRQGVGRRGGSDGHFHFVVQVSACRVGR
jgi:hypothetical protein